MTADISIDQPRRSDPACNAKGFGRVIGRPGAKANAAVLECTDSGDGVDGGGNGVLLASVGQCNLDGGACQLTRGWPFASYSLSACLTHADDHRRTCIKIGHYSLPNIS